MNRNILVLLLIISIELHVCLCTRRHKDRHSVLQFIFPKHKDLLYPRDNDEWIERLTDAKKRLAKTTVNKSHVRNSEFENNKYYTNGGELSNQLHSSDFTNKQTIKNDKQLKTHGTVEKLTVTIKKNVIIKPNIKQNKKVMNEGVKGSSNCKTTQKQNIRKNIDTKRNVNQQERCSFIDADSKTVQIKSKKLDNQETKRRKQDKQPKDHTGTDVDVEYGISLTETSTETLIEKKIMPTRVAEPINNMGTLEHDKMIMKQKDVIPRKNISNTTIKQSLTVNKRYDKELQTDNVTLSTDIKSTKPISEGNIKAHAGTNDSTSKLLKSLRETLQKLYKSHQRDGKDEANWSYVEPKHNKNDQNTTVVEKVAELEQKQFENNIKSIDEMRSTNASKLLKFLRLSDNTDMAILIGISVGIVLMLAIFIGMHLCCYIYARLHNSRPFQTNPSMIETRGMVKGITGSGTTLVSIPSFKDEQKWSGKNKQDKNGMPEEQWSSEEEIFNAAAHIYTQFKKTPSMTAVSSKTSDTLLSEPKKKGCMRK